MIISAINRFCARHGRLTYTFIGVAIIIPFVFLYGDFGGTLGSGSGQAVHIGEMYGEPINRVQFFKHMDAANLTFFLDYGQPLDRNNEKHARVLAEQALQRLRAIQEAKSQGIDHISSDEVQDKILSIPLFQTNNKFDRNKFNAFKTRFLPAQGLTAKDFDRIIHDNIIVERIEKRVTNGVVVSEAESRAAYLEYFSQCTVQVADFLSYKYLADVVVTEDEVEAYFNEHLEEKYRVPVQNKVQAVVFNSDDYEVKYDIGDDELRAYYDENRDREFGKAQLQIRHILIRSGPEDTEDARVEKRERAAALLDTVRSTGDIETVARTESEDTFSAPQGGDLGFMNVDTLRARYGDAFVTAAEAIGAGEINSDIVESRMGFHILQNVDQRDSVPFEEVRDQIERTLTRQRDEAESVTYYEENKDAKYAKEEVHARHILLKIAPDDSEEVKNEKKAKLETILAEAREKDNFIELAKTHSEDDSNAAKGGDLGFFGRGRMVKPFEDAAYAMEIGEFSDVVETNFGFHIIQKIATRNEQPYADVKNTVISDMRRERKEQAKEAASRDATNFAVRAFTELREIAGKQKAAAFAALCRRYKKARSPLTPLESGYFTADDYNVADIPGYTGNLAKEGMKLNAENPLSEVIESGQYYYVACWQSSRDSYLPAFREKAAPGAANPDAMVLSRHAKLAERDLKNERALRLARDAAQSVYDEVKAALDSGAAFTEAAGDHPFAAQGPFALNQGPGGNNGDVIQSVARETPGGTLAAPMETTTGALLIYVDSHSLPNPQEFAEIESFWNVQYRQQKQQLHLDDYYKELEKKSETTIADDWQYMFEEVADTAAATAPNEGSAATN